MRVTGAIVLALAAGASALAADEDYLVRLTRPTKVGSRHRLDAKGKLQEQQRVTVGRQMVKNEEKNLEIHFVALATVLAVDSKSSATRTEHVVELCQKLSSGQTREIVARGSRVIAEYKNGKTAFTINGEPAAADVAEALDVVISAHEPGSATDDEIFGTNERKRVGDKWGINSAAAIRDLSRKGLTLSAGDINGSVRLDGVRTVDAVKALEISAHLRANRLGMANTADVQVEKGSLEADFNGLVPVDPQSHVLLSDKMHMRIDLRMSGQKPDTGEKILVEGLTEITLENNYAPAKREVEPQSSLRLASVEILRTPSAER